MHGGSAHYDVSSIGSAAGDCRAGLFGYSDGAPESPMQYHCVQCNEVFTMDPGQDKPRCPKCLRQHGLRPVEASQPAARSSRRWLGPSAAVLVLALGAGGYALYMQAHKHKPGEVPMAPIDVAALREDVRALAGVDAGELAQLLESDAKVSAFAERATRGAASVDAKAKAANTSRRSAHGRGPNHATGRRSRRRPPWQLSAATARVVSSIRSS
jgi:hypothetical protein